MVKNNPVRTRGPVAAVFTEYSKSSIFFYFYKRLRNKFIPKCHLMIKTSQDSTFMFRCRAEGRKQLDPVCVCAINQPDVLRNISVSN